MQPASSAEKHSLSANFQQDGAPAGSEPWVTEVTKFEVNGQTRLVVLSADTSTLAVAVGEEIHVYDTATSQLLQTLRGHAGYTVANLEFHPRGRKLAAGYTRYSSRTRQELVVAVVDVATLTERFRFTGHTDAIMWAETSPNDKLVATSCWDRTVRIWSTETGDYLRVLEGANGQSWAGAFSPDGELIAAGAGDKSVRIWRVDTGELLHTLSGFGGWVRSLAFTPDGLQLAAGSEGGTVLIFDVNSGERAQTWQVNVETNPSARRVFLEFVSVRYTSRGDLFFCSSDGRIFGYRASQNLKWEFLRPFLADGTWFKTYALSGDGSKLIAANGSEVGIWKID
ncbi:WD40-repeat-containing domain protein [Mycena capillaripes]|nr:WD40-repeat-containing domain protein [Mycena capillaripes]